MTIAITYLLVVGRGDERAIDDATWSPGRVEKCFESDGRFAAIVRIEARNEEAAYSLSRNQEARNRSFLWATRFIEDRIPTEADLVNFYDEVMHANA